MIISEFKYFDHKADFEPESLLPMLPKIAERVHLLLAPRIEYFRTIREEEISRLSYLLFNEVKYDKYYDCVASDFEKANELFDWIDTSEGSDFDGYWVPSSEHDQVELYLPTIENTSKVEALINRCDSKYQEWSAVAPPPDEKPYEYFAILSLMALNEAIESLDSHQSDLDKDQGKPPYSVNTDNFLPAKVSSAIENLLKAMDAVCNAEHLEKTEYLHNSLIDLKKKSDSLARYQICTKHKAETTKIKWFPFQNDFKELIAKGMKASEARYYIGNKIETAIKEDPTKSLFKKRPDKSTLSRQLVEKNK